MLADFVSINKKCEFIPQFSKIDENNRFAVLYPNDGKLQDLRSGEFFVLREVLSNYADGDIREQSRKYISDISNTVLKCTGKKVYESLPYKGVSAWWFLEIVFQEPVFLHLRTKKILNDLKNNNIHSHLFKKHSQVNILPVVSWNENQVSPSILTKLQDKFKFPIKRTFVKSLKLLLSRMHQHCIRHKDVLMVYEHENLRMHLDRQTKTYVNSLTYAEGVAEVLHELKPGKVAVLNRSLFGSKFNWKPMTGKLIMRPHKGISKKQKLIVKEIHGLLPVELQNKLDVKELQFILGVKMAEFDYYFSILKKINPKVIFTYNWEGVFRPFISAAKLLNIKVAGIQQALGPYSHALNHQEIGYWTSENQNTMKFPIPDRLFLWGSFHKEQFITYGYPEKNLLITGYPRLDKHFRANQSKLKIRTTVAKLLNLDPNKKYLLFTVQYKVLNTCLINEFDFKDTLFKLLQLADMYDFCIILKPWSGDDHNFLMTQASQRPDRLFFAPQTIVVSNADLLTLTDWCVSTFSSIIGEALLSDNLCFLVNYIESKSYFEEKHMKLYEPFTITISEPKQIIEKLPKFLSSSDLLHEQVQKYKRNLYPVFGPCDGLAAERIGQEIIDMI